MVQRYDVFISYLRDGGADLAQLLTTALTSRGYRVFLDVRDMPSGPFPESLRMALAEVTDVITLLTPGCLHAFDDPLSWYAREIHLALANRRNIIPVTAPGFTLPIDHASQSVRQLLLLQHISYSHSYADATVDAICQRFMASPMNVALRRRNVEVLARYGAWSMRRGVHQITGLANGQGFTITMRRSSNWGKATITLTIDGMAQFVEELSFPGVGRLTREFIMGAENCRISITCATAAAFASVRIGDTALISFRPF